MESRRDTGMLAATYRPRVVAPQMRILLVDDDDVDREVVRRMLPKTGVETELQEVASGMHALAAVPNGRYDVVLLDYELPRHDGLSVLREIREIDPHLPVVMLTGHEDTDLAVEMMRNGAADYLSKGTLSPQRLAQALRHASRIRTAEIAARAAEDALKATEDFNRRLTSAFHDVVEVLDLEARVVSVGLGGRKVLEMEDEAHGAPWVDFWGVGDRASVEMAVTTARAGGVGRFAGLRPSGRGRDMWWDVVVTPILDTRGTPERLLAVAREVVREAPRGRQKTRPAA